MSEMRKCDSYKSTYNLCAQKSWPHSLLLLRFSIQRAKFVDTMNVLGLAFRNAKVVKRNMTVVLTYSARFLERKSYISIYSLAYTGICNNFRAQGL